MRDFFWGLVNGMVKAFPNELMKPTSTLKHLKPAFKDVQSFWEQETQGTSNETNARITHMQRLLHCMEFLVMANT